MANSKHIGLKTVSDMRSILADEIVRMRNGKTTPGNVNAIVNACGKILSGVKLEMEYNKMLGLTPHIDFIQVQAPSRKALKQIEEKKLQAVK